MYLKSIEVHGFKSFANKLKFQFHNGITGIVGPNGSGKSNVADAVRWVLGEQSVKQLRGSNMQDVIFSGTENRKPLGSATVAITLDNSDHKLPVDFDEVTVTRRLYRSGESEYLINGTTCRLKDVRELFYDTGIGKEGYSIIGQGQIDKILNGKPEERRELFDEAAGIVKFKRRKQAAQKKLEDENNNLTRIDDILSELTRQVGPLERQAEKAKIYLKKKEELKEYDLNMFLLDSEKIEGQIKSVDEKITISDHDLSQAKENLEKAKKEYEQVELQLEELDRQLDEKKTLLNQSTLTKQQFENQVALLKEQIRSASATRENLNIRLESLKNQIEEKEAAAEEKKQEYGNLQEILLKAQEEEQAQNQILSEYTNHNSELESMIMEGQSRLIQLLNDRSNTKVKLQRYDTMSEQIEIRKAELTKRILTSKGEEVQLIQEKEGYQKEYDRISGYMQEIEGKNSEIENQINLVQGELIQKSNKLEEIKADFHRTESRLDSLKNMSERYDGYGNSIRRVMEQKTRESGLHGVVADLIKTEKKYETAIETALGGSIQNIVTSDENTAKRMIEFLKRNKFGRATFLPLTAIKGKGGIGNENALYEPGVIGVASTLVDAEDTYDQLVEYLLGKTLVVDHIDHGIAIARKYRQSIRIVTLEGDLISPGGSMSGGAFKNSSNLLGRKRELDDLEVQLNSKKEEIVSLQKRIEELRDKRTSLREKLVDQTDLMQKEKIKQNTVKIKLQEIASQNSKTIQDYEALKSEAHEIEGQIQEIAEGKIAIEKEFELSVAEEKDLEIQITGWQKEQETVKSLQESQSNKVSNLQMKTAQLRQQSGFIRQESTRISSELLQLREEKEKLESGLDEAMTDSDGKEQQILSIEKTIEEAKEKIQEETDRIDALTQERRIKNEAHKKFFDTREELSSELSLLDKERMRLETQKERLEDYRERQINYIWEEYELTESEAKAFRKEEHSDIAVLKKQTAQIKNEIRSLGTVNVNAIEEYKEVAERHKFLSEQHSDLIKAEEALRQIITELDQGMRKQFREKFAIIQKEFEKAFKELFGGGKGTLELVEEEDVLEAGIVINAQPPGKKLVNMMQMSGGEKALTAIALLFAIQNMKPSPFCLLDEIEAALDENNVSRYANYLHKLTKNTQFIIITHRRGTMEAADRLYGITMQEKGVSTQVSVNMVENEIDQ